MAALGQYVVSVSAAAILCGIILSLSADSGHKEILRLLCGVFLTVTALSPVTKITLPDLADFSEAYLEQGSALAAQGEMLARETMVQIIKTETEAYILDKATGLGLSLRVVVRISEGIPSGVVLEGEASPYQRQQLIRIITEELGISKENLQWSGIS